MKLLSSIVNRLRSSSPVCQNGRMTSQRAMGLAGSETQFLQELAGQFRLLLIGRAATVAHGAQLTPCDYEVWMEPLRSESEWIKALHGVVNSFLHIHLSAPRSRVPTALHMAESTLRERGALGVMGLDVPVVVHRRANEFNLEEFDRVWKDARPLLPGLRLPSITDLFLNKINTGRHADYEDMIWLEEQVRIQFADRLPVCDEAEAERLLARYIDPESLRHALINPHFAVRDLARRHLERFAAAGDPYSAEILESWFDASTAAAA